MPTPISIRVRALEKSDEARWHELWQGYLVFYEKVLPADVTAFTWQRIFDPASSINAIVAEAEGAGVIGFANYFLHENTWSLTPNCCLEDLFVDPQWRGMGIGTKLIDWLIGEMGRQRWDRLYWHTHQDNARARSVYDRYTTHSGFIRYVLTPDTAHQLGD
jgi:GNAT superfamily N-acetyltransferase